MTVTLRSVKHIAKENLWLLKDLSELYSVIYTSIWLQYHKVCKIVDKYSKTLGIVLSIIRKILNSKLVTMWAYQNTKLVRGSLCDQEFKKHYTMEIRFQRSQLLGNCWSILWKRAAKDKSKRIQDWTSNQEKWWLTVRLW